VHEPFKFSPPAIDQVGGAAHAAVAMHRAGRFSPSVDTNWAFPTQELIGTGPVSRHRFCYKLKRTNNEDMHTSITSA